MDHATSDVHKAAMAKLKVKCSRATGESAATLSTIWRFVIDGRDAREDGEKFDVCFMMAKESLPFIKYPALLELESRHGVDLGSATVCPIQ